jgi:hypothetical protein
VGDLACLINHALNKSTRQAGFAGAITMNDGDNTWFAGIAFDL